MIEIEDIPEGLRWEYKQTCDVCQRTTTVLTQDAHLPEYETEVFIRCSCGNYLEFNLPVN